MLAGAFGRQQQGAGNGVQEGRQEGLPHSRRTHAALRGPDCGKMELLSLRRLVIGLPVGKMKQTLLTLE